MNASLFVSRKRYHCQRRAFCISIIMKYTITVLKLLPTIKPFYASKRELLCVNYLHKSLSLQECKASVLTIYFYIPYSNLLTLGKKLVRDNLIKEFENNVNATNYQPFVTYYPHCT